MADDFPITIFHNPNCGTSRNVLAMIRAAGYSPAVIEYLKTGWTRPQLTELLAAMQAKPRDILREKGTPAAELAVDLRVGDDQLLDAMTVYPILVNAIVVTPKGTSSSPLEAVFDLLDGCASFATKEDGEVIAPRGTKSRC